MSSRLVTSAIRRIPLSLTLLGPLAVVGLILAAGAYLLLDAHRDAATNERLEDRTSDVARLLGPVLADKSRIGPAATAAAQLDGVRTVAAVDVDRRSIVAGTTAEAGSENQASQSLSGLLARDVAD